MISAYLDSLAGALSFDRSLARCVRQEVEDHLREAVAADPVGGGLAAERRAIARFGDPHLIAAQFAVASLARQSKRAGAVVILAIAGTFVVMKARVAWYAMMESVLSDELKVIGAIVGAIDRYAFWLSVGIGLAAWLYISSRRIPAAFHPAYRRQLRCFLLLCIAAAAALAVSVISDGVLTALRLPVTDLCAASLVPLFSMAIEIACAGVLVVQIGAVAQREASTAALLKV
jgi:hypothetical protein